MGRTTKNGESGKRRRAVWLVLFSLALLTACGCSTTSKSKGDPLMGEFGPKGEVKPPPAPTKTSSNQVPPIPTATSNINNSNLAAGTLPGSRNLAIEQPQTNPAMFPRYLAGANDPANHPVLPNPNPVVEPVPRDNTSVVPTSNWDKGKQPPPPDPLLTQQPATTSSQPPTRQGLTWPDVNWAANPPPQPAAVNPPPPGQAPVDPLQAQLKSKGVTWQRAENVAGGVKFTCIMPNPQNPQVSRAYEAIGPDYPAAVRAVLWEIDNRK